MIKRSNALEVAYSTSTMADNNNMLLGAAFALARFGQWFVRIGDSGIVMAPNVSWIMDEKVKNQFNDLEMADLLKVDPMNPKTGFGIAAVIVQFSKFEVQTLDAETFIMIPDLNGWVEGKVREHILRGIAEQIKIDGYSVRASASGDSIIIQIRALAGAPKLDVMPDKVGERKIAPVKKDDMVIYDDDEINKQMNSIVRFLDGDDDEPGSAHGRPRSGRKA